MEMRGWKTEVQVFSPLAPPSVSHPSLARASFSTCSHGCGCKSPTLPLGQALSLLCLLPLQGYPGEAAHVCPSCLLSLYFHLPHTHLVNGHFMKPRNVAFSARHLFPARILSNVVKDRVE